MSSDNYATPKAIFACLDNEFHFNFDVCAEPHTTKCSRYWSKKDDALSKYWVDDLPIEVKANKRKWLWCNPPYSNITPWVKKASEAQRNGVGVVMLVMADPSVQWFKNALKTVSEVRFIHGRISFLDKHGNAVNGNNKGSCIFVFDPCRLGTRHVSFVDRQDMIDRGLAAYGCMP